ncbi:MAG: glycosyltransferase family 4 protein [Paludibacter sp.]|nr:glycosyltransferase family 4 protein [Paludibacter sp.]
MSYILLFILLFAAELAYFKVADHFNIIDKPNERSSHTTVTLRGGGIIFYIGILFYFIFNGFQYPWFFLGLTLISVISFADDIHPRSNKLRLIVHFIAMGLMFYEWNLFSFPWYFSIIALIICTGILNAYNFMDGINGITGGYSLVVTAALWYINSYQIQFIDNELIYALLSAIIVFNFFNFRTKAKCFAGDVGAISIAFIVIFLLGKLIIETADYSYIVLLVVYGVDTVLTIIHRLILKENIFEAHRKHAYQLMANELKIPHVFVSLFYTFSQLAIVAGFIAFQTYSYWYFLVVTLALSTGYVCLKRKYFYLHKMTPAPPVCNEG